ncbi:hypothetical protein [Dactylosporangium sp. NPDC000521]|uniref:hypothetical protein n=1 Tax=Dactylosporangium sp. NPDC000521 TaxID=3363975 RepID=UPI0036A5DD98
MAPEFSTANLRTAGIIAFGGLAALALCLPWPRRLYPRVAGAEPVASATTTTRSGRPRS